uniref:Uncharacterized protein n=1 Tax=Romanomermis culicivorax TaxID=13658 RepID=A0A915I3L8_ROMCU
MLINKVWKLFTLSLALLIVCFLYTLVYSYVTQWYWSEEEGRLNDSSNRYKYSIVSNDSIGLETSTLATKIWTIDLKVDVISTTSRPQIHLQGCTVVTALLDIGRGNWSLYRRRLSFYMSAMKRVLALNAPMYIFADAWTADFIADERAKNNFSDKTIVDKITLENLPYYKEYFPIISKIVENEQQNCEYHRELLNRKPQWDPAMKNHPEAFSPKYILLMNSKPYMLHKAARINSFHSTHFFWLDAGYGHGTLEVAFPLPDKPWCPKNVVKSVEKVTILTLQPELKLSQITLENLYRKDVVLIIGSFFGGSIWALDEFYHLYDRVFKNLAIFDQTKKMKKWKNQVNFDFMMYWTPSWEWTPS